MRRVLILALFVVGGCNVNGSRLFRTEPIDLAAVSRDLAGGSSRLTQLERQPRRHPGVLLEATDLIEHQVGSARWTEHRITTRRYLVGDPEDDDLSTFTLRTSPGERLEGAQLVVAVPGRAPRTFTKEDLISRRDSDGTVSYKLAYPGLTRGALIAVRVHRIRPRGVGQSVRHRLSLAFGLPCRRREVRYVSPRGWTIQVKAPGANRAWRVRREDRDGREVRVFVRRQIPAMPSQGFSPSGDADIPDLDIRVHAHRVGSTFVQKAETWDDIASMYRRGYVLRARGPAAAGAVVVAREQIEGVVDGAERVQRIIDYVQRTFESDDDAPANSYEALLVQRRGSPTLITGYAQLLLQAAGMSAMVRADQSGSQWLFRPQLPQPRAALGAGAPDRRRLPAGARVPVPARVARGVGPGRPAGTDGADDPGRGCSPAVSDAGAAGEAQPGRARGGAGDRPRERSVRVRERRRLHGMAAAKLRVKLAVMNLRARRRALEQMRSYSDGGVKVSSARVIGGLGMVGGARRPLTIELNYLADNLVTVDRHRALVRVAGLLAPLSRSRAALPTRGRTRRVAISNNSMLVRTLTISRPAGWRLEIPPRPKTFQNRFGTVRTEVTGLSGDALRLKQTVWLKRAEGSPRSLPQLNRLLEQVADQQWETLVFSQAAVPTS